MQDKYLITVSVLCASVISGLVAALVVSRVIAHRAALQGSAANASLRELKIVDDSGRICLTLSATNGLPTINLLGKNGKPRLSMSLDAQDYSAVRLTNPSASGPVASLEIDDKGTHVKFDRPGGGSSYMFLNNGGGSGAVFFDAAGVRKLDFMVSPTGHTDIRRYDQPSSKLP